MGIFKRISRYLKKRRIEREKRREQELIERKRELRKERERQERERERLELRQKKEERKAWEKAQEHKKKRTHELIKNIDKDRKKIADHHKHTTPEITETAHGGYMKFLGKKFLFCKDSFHEFTEYFHSNDWYYLVVIDGYLGRRSKRKDYIQYFHRWVMRDEVEIFADENGVDEDEVQVHHVDLTTTNNKLKNLKPMLKADHKKLHIRLKFDGSDEAFDDWYKEKEIDKNN